MQQLPVGEQEFVQLRERNNLYVDKTHLIWELMNAGRFLFLARPRRFGKSLLITILEEIYRGNRDLFHGLWIEDKIDWQPHPVIVINFNDINYQEPPLGDALAVYVDKVAAQYQLTLQSHLYKAKFQELITRLDTQNVEQGGKPHRVVLLINEYDKPITDLLDDNPKLGEKIAILRNFYAVLKAPEAIHLDFTLVTGSFPRDKIPAFPELNHLLDFTLDPRFAPLLGDTEAEMEAFFDCY